MMNSTNHPPTFHQWLKRLRARQHLTQEALAELAFCSVQLIRFFENGRRRPSLEMAEQLATVLQVSTEQHDAFIRLARTPIAEAELQVEEETPSSPETLPTAAAMAKPFLPPLEHLLIGREGEHNILRHLLLHEQRRLVTLIGAGGMGKTQLALDVATALIPHFRDGAAFVALTALQAASQLPVAVAEALRLPLGASDPQEAVLTLLAPRHLLLVLDGFEQLLHRESGAAAQWVNRLLQQAPQVQVLVTSRERLRLSGERIFELGGLSLPSNTVAPEAAEAVLLFLERAQQAAGHFVLDAQNKAAIVQICQLVGGMPLGIELAAAWVHVLTPEEIAEELARNVDFLARANRDTPARHRSLRAIFDHSWELLTEQEQRVLMRLAIFRGGCQREAAQTVAGATLPVLASLIDKSLVQRLQHGDHTRYDLHEVVRQFAAEKSVVNGVASPPIGPQPLDDIQLAHYDYFFHLAATARPHLQDSEQLHWLQVLDNEHANLRAALERCLTAGDHARGLRLALQLEEFWYVRGHHREGLTWFRHFLSPTPTHVEAEQPTLDETNGFAAAGILAIAGGNYVEARTDLERSLAAARVLDDPATLAKVLRYRGIVALHEEAYAEAELILSEAATIGSALNSHYELATTFGHLAEIALVQQHFQRAQALGEQAVQLLRVTQDKNQLAGALRRLAQAHLYQGQFTSARHYALESLALNNEVHDRRGTAASTVVLSSVLEPQAQWSAIAQMLGAADALLTQAQASLLPGDQVEYARIRAICLAELGAEFAPAHERGRTQLSRQQDAPYDLDWIKQLFVA
ncbi:MAG: helix-turn-helix domain-containing protein [Caldilineaceae bacterium]